MPSTWTFTKVKQLFDLPFNDLLFRAHRIYRKHFDPNKIKIATLLSIKTGACPEDCAYCPQSAHYKSGQTVERLLPLDKVIAAAKKAKAAGATRFCMGAGWRNPRDKDLAKVIAMIKAVNALGLETCATLGMLTETQVKALEEAELNYYNHNLDTSADFYKKIISTRSYQDRLDTLKLISQSKIKTCCGGIIGMGESLTDRVQLLLEISQLDEIPESIPINYLVKIPSTPLEHVDEINFFDFARMIAVTRIMFPLSFVRLSAGRNDMSAEQQAICFFAGANSFFFGEKLLVTPLPLPKQDMNLLQNLGINTYSTKETGHKTCRIPSEN